MVHITCPVIQIDSLSRLHQLISDLQFLQQQQKQKTKKQNKKKQTKL
jgi:hypothetical protein